MTRRRRGGPALAIVLGVAVLVAGCAGGRQLLTQAETPQDVNWRKVATAQDRTRLRQWRQAWIEALAAVRGGAASADRTVSATGAAILARDPRLFDPDRALPGAALSVGRYRCRMTKLGARDAAAAPIRTSAWTACVVAEEGAARTFAIDGAQRLFGYLFDDADARSVFLGTLALGDETRPMRYARDARRDAAGFVERIGEARWRLMLPYPGFESTLDVVEIVPAG